MHLLNDTQKRVLFSIAYEPLSIGKIAQRTGMHRQSVRIVLEVLVKEKFVHITKNHHKQFYSIANLSAVRDMYLTKLEMLKKDLPRLELLYNETKNTQIINLLQGTSGLRTALIDEVIKGKEILAYHTVPILKEYRNIFAENDLRRKQLRIPLRLLSSQKEHELPFSKIRTTKKRTSVDIVMYADKVSLFYYMPKPLIIVLKIPSVTQFFRNLFEKEWCK